jgi:Mpv17 / PMP22 family
MFGSGASVSIVLSKVLFDLLVQTTLLTLPIAYLTKALLYQYHPVKAMKLYWNDIVHQGLLQKYFLLWGPVQCLTFSIIPEHFRVAFIACVSFFWLIILSKLSSKTQQQFLPAAPVVAVETQLDKLLNGKQITEAVAIVGE